MTDESKRIEPRVPASCAVVPVFRITQVHVERKLRIPERNITAQLVEVLLCEDGKEAALVRIVDEQGSTPFLFCSCDFHAQVMDTDAHMSCHWMSRCPTKQALRDKYGEATKVYYQSAEWANRPLKEKILDIFHRVRRGEYLGQWEGSMIYVQEVARVLGVEMLFVLDECRTLFKEERLDLSGMILTEYVPRFRFPKELQNFMAYMIEEPLGWPNGDAGDGFLYRLEQAIHEHTDYKSGKDAFGEWNYPHISPHLLVAFGSSWLLSGIQGLQEDANELQCVDCDGLEANLRSALREVRKLAQKQRLEKKKEKEKK